MNLVLSGPIDDNLRNAVADLSKPRNIVRLHARAYRFEVAEDGSPTRARVADLCDADRVDHAYVEEGKRFSDFRLLAMDMDSTLITIECIDEIADFAGKKAEVAAITEAAMRGEIADFAESLRRRVALLAGVSVDALKSVYDERLRLSAGARELINAAKRYKLYRVLLSGGFTYFTERLRQDLLFDAAFSNKLDTQDSILTGHVAEPILDGHGKRRALEGIMLQFNYMTHQAMVIGDGANDIPMLQLSPYSIAYHANSPTEAAAEYSIKHGSLSTVLDFFP